MNITRFIIRKMISPTRLKSPFFGIFILFFYFLDQVQHVTAANCVDIVYESSEFRLSAGKFETDNMKPFICQAVCKTSKYEYAAIMDGHYCLCANTTNDYKIDSKCCMGPPMCQPEQLLAMEVNDDYVTTEVVSLEITTLNSPDGDEIKIINSLVNGYASVPAEISVYMNDALTAEPMKVFLAYNQLSLIKGLGFPGRYLIKAEIIDTDTEKLSAFDVREILVPDEDVSYELECPAEVQSDQEFQCILTVFRGLDLTVEIEFEGEDETETLVLPDAATNTFGPDIPRYWKSSKTHLPPDKNFLGCGRLPYGKIIGVEYFAIASGSFDLAIFEPDCGVREEFCVKCQSTCPEKNTLACNNDNEVLYSVNVDCIKLDDDPMYPKVTGNFKERASYSVSSKVTGYDYKMLDEDDYLDIEPGVFVVVKKNNNNNILAFREYTEAEKAMGITDTDDRGTVQNFGLLVRVLVSETSNISFTHSYSEGGEHKLITKMSSKSGKKTVDRDAVIVVASMLSGLRLNDTEKCGALGANITLHATLEKGKNVTLFWYIDSEEWKRYALVSLDDPISEDFECEEVRNYTITLKAANENSEVNDSITVCCALRITRNWKIETNTPKITPPGDMKIVLQYNGEKEKFSGGVKSDWEFGDGESESEIPVENAEDSIEKIHNYTKAGTYVVEIKVYNNYDEEEFTTEVEVFDRLGGIELEYFYKKTEDDDMVPPQGPNNTDVPLGSTVIFRCNATGYDENYTLTIPTDSFKESNEEGVFTHIFKNAGEYEAECQAFNKFESSDNITVRIRVLAETVGLELVALKTPVEPQETVEFNIIFNSSDEFTCYTFHAGEIIEEDETTNVKQTFGDEETCKLFLEEDQMVFNDRDSKRERREVKDVSWIDDKTISILYAYQSEGVYNATAEALNIFFQGKDSEMVQVEELPVDGNSKVWIENNSTSKRHPMRYRRSQTFRLETTALLKDHPSYTYVLNWEVNEIDKAGEVIRNIDISDLRSKNLSALRFPRRYLEVGLYNLTYTIDIYENNDTLIETLSTFTYLEIIKTPLRPMIIRGGASYILRGAGQTVNLEPAVYSVDPDDPEEKGFEIEWSCRSFDSGKFLDDGEQYDSSTSLSSKAITWYKSENTESEAKCFKDDKDSEMLQDPNVAFNTDDLLSYETLYEFKAVISKDSRTAISRVFLDVIKDEPLSILIMCERPVACTAYEDSFYVNPNSRLMVRAECIADCPPDVVTYEWDIYAVDEKNSTLIALDDWRDHSVVDEDRLGIYTSFFDIYEKHLQFHIQVTAIDEDDEKKKGVAKLYIRVNRPPEPGGPEGTENCIVSNGTDHGTSMITHFSMEFGEWTDPDDHPIVDYNIFIIYENRTFRIHYGVKTSVDFVLPPGESEVICAVEDEFGAIGFVSAGMVTASVPEDEEKEEYESEVNFNFFIVQGKIHVLPQTIAADAFLDEQKKEEFHETLSDEVDRIWQTYLEQPGIDTSYYTKEAREEIEAEIKDSRSGERVELASKNEEMFEKIDILDYEVAKDVEVNGYVVSALSQSRPLNKESKNLLNRFIREMYLSMEEEEFAHVDDKTISYMLIANSMNSLSETLSNEILGGEYLESELEEAYEYMSYNLTQPNYFIFYMEGNRWEVAERVHQAKVDMVKNISQGEVDGQMENMKNITDEIIKEVLKDIMVGETPYTVKTTSGLQILAEKRSIKEIAGKTIDNEGSTVTVPDGCVLLGKAPGCQQRGSVGISFIKWTNIFELEGTENVDLSPESSAVDISLTNRAGNESITIKDAEQPFEVCLSISPPSSGQMDTEMRFVRPIFGEKDDFLAYHSVTLDKEGSAVKMDFLPEKDAESFVFLYGVGFKPALNAYDGLMYVKDLEGKEDAYSILFTLEQYDPSPGDTFYLAIGLLAENQSSETNLTRDDMTNEFDFGYYIGMYTTGCYYFSEETSKWSSKGCKVHTAQSDKICCHCNHLTLFGGGFLVAPNKIDFSYVFANAGFDDNLIIYLTIILTFSLYIVFLIWARWKDRKDLQKLGATPLLDNDIQDKYFYEIQVQTGFQLNAGTKSKVHFIISGEDKETDVRTFTDEERPIFERGAINVFVMTVPRCLGQLNYLRIWHDNSGKENNASWYCKYIVVKDIHTGYKYEFMVERWFSIEDGGMIDHLIPVASREQTTEFSHLFSNTSQRNLTDNHLWLSVFTRPPRSRFTRVQRLSCCFSMLYLSMLASAMWYETVPEQPASSAFKFGPLSLSPEQISVGLMSNLVIFPPSFLMIFFFRKSRARILRPSHVTVALKIQYDRWRKDYGTPEEKSGRTDSKEDSKRTKDEEAMEVFAKKRKKLSLPWWCVYISWMLVVASVGGSMFFLWAYGLQFGNDRTGKWLTSLVISFFSSVLLTEPIKIFFLAIIMACLCGNPDVDEDDADQDEQDPHLEKDEDWMHNINSGVMVQRPKYRPIDQRSLEAARKLREKEVMMYKTLQEIGLYFLYLWILMILSYGNRDPNSFFIRETFINNYIKPGDLWVDFNTITTEPRFWNWTREALIPELFAGKWYNGRVPLGLRLLVDDRSNFKVGYPILRQVRAAKNACKVPWQMDYIISECAGFGNLVNEDGSYYKSNWQGNISIESRIPQEYKYLTAAQLNGFPFWGQLDWYGGGGYVVPLVAKLYEDGEKLRQKMFDLERSGWIDKDTRAVFAEFGTYNAQVNLFVVVTIVAEFLPGGGIVPYYHIDPIKLLHYHTGSGLIQLICQILFLIFTAYYTISELGKSCKLKRKYLSEYWNVAELFNLLAAYSIIGVEIYKMIVTMRILEIFTATEGTGYIKLQEALILDECFCYLIGFLMSLATLKFIKLLRFNKRIGIMIATLKLCAEELKSYGVCLMITFFAFVTLFWLILGRGVKEFSSFLYSFESSISMLLKKFNYYDIEAASPIIGPIAFFTFALTASVVLVNILLTIIIQSFEEVKYDTNFQNCDYELVPFMWNRLRLFFGCGCCGKKNKAQIIPVAREEAKEEDKNNVVDSFSGKVDKLLDFINSVYLDELVDAELVSQFHKKPEIASYEKNIAKKKSRPRKIPRYQSRHVKKHLDF